MCQPLGEQPAAAQQQCCVAAVPVPGWRWRGRRSLLVKRTVLGRPLAVKELPVMTLTVVFLLMLKRTALKRTVLESFLRV